MWPNKTFDEDINIVKNIKIENTGVNHDVSVKSSGLHYKDLEIYAENYFYVTNIIADYILIETSDISILDTMVFPMAFSFRHALELLMKSIILTNSRDSNNCTINAGHDLLALFELVKKTVCFSKDDEIWLTKFFEELHRKDKESDLFRYPFMMNKDMRILFGEEYTFGFENRVDLDLNILIEKFRYAFIGLQSNGLNRYKKPNNTVLLEEGGGYYERAVLGRFRDKFSEYIEGYFNCGVLLRSKQENREIENKAFFPMIYFYRLSLEILLKKMIYENIFFDENKKSKILNKEKHNICKIWKEIKEWYYIFDPSDQEAKILFEDIYITLDNIEKNDCTSSKYRYPFDKKMKSYFSQKRNTTYTLKNTAIVFESIINRISGIEGYLNEIYKYHKDAEGLNY